MEGEGSNDDDDVGEEEIAVERDTRINKITNNSVPKA